MTSPAYALLIDDFDGSPGGVTNLAPGPITLSSGDIIGGSRTLEITSSVGPLGNFADVVAPPGELFFFNEPLTSGSVEIRYDANGSGLGGIDLTEGGLDDRFNIDGTVFTGTADLTLTVSDTTGGLSTLDISFTIPEKFPFSDFVGSADFSDVDGILLSMAGSEGSSMALNSFETGGLGNSQPTITTSATPSVPENTTSVIDIQSVDDNDSEGAGLTYTKTGGADQALFSLDGSTGVLTFTIAPDFENPTDAGADNVYDIQVTVTDSGPGTTLIDVQDIAVTVTDVIGENPDPLQCADNEQAINHQCVPLDCADNEQAINHQCVPLDCADNEQAINHQCVPLDCADNEQAINHQCVPLDCEESTLPAFSVDVSTTNVCVPDPESGMIHGQKYQDTNGNGRHDYHEPYLNGWTIFIDENRDGYLDDGEQSTITGNYGSNHSKKSPDIALGQMSKDGYYWFTDLPKGDYKICEVLRKNWVQTQPGTPHKAECYWVTIDSKNQSFDGLDFGNYEMGAITGQKYEDINGNGMYDYGEPSLEGWTIFLDENGNGYLDNNEKSTVTHSDYPGDPAHYEFRELLLGDYRVCEVLEDNWVQTQPGSPQKAQCYDETIDFSGEICAYHDFGNLYLPKGKASLTVFTTVINDNGGTAVPSDFTMLVTADSPSDNNFAGSSTGKTIAINPGAFNVTQLGPENYSSTFSGCSGIAVEGESYICTVICEDDDGPTPPPEPPSGKATLTVIKNVINDDGGTAVPSDFTMLVTAGSPSDNNFAGTGTGKTITINPGAFGVTELDPGDYDVSFSGCTGTAIAGESYTCTITNNDKNGGSPISATLTVIKNVINDNGGTAVPSDFTMLVNNPPIGTASFDGSSSGVTIAIGTGTTTVTEDAVTGYTSDGGVGDCNFVAVAGQSYTCTITNNYDEISPLAEDRAGHNQWDTRPTFGISHETRDNNKPVVDNGFSFNYEFLTINDNHHTLFDEQLIRIGTVNSFTAKVYADKGLKVQEFLFGVPEIGLGHLAEVRVEVWYNLDGQIEDVRVIQDSDVIDMSTLNYSALKTKCLETDTEERCDMTTVSGIFLEPLQYNVMAIKAIDFERRGQTTYFNDGFDVMGDSLNPMTTMMIPSPAKGEGLIEVTQNEKYGDYWSTADGRIFEMNSFGSFKQINQSFERFQDSGNAFNRVHSDFGKIIEYEQNRALQIFNATNIQSELPDSFSHDITISERITEEMIQEMIIQEHIAQKLLDEKYVQDRW